jgi:hypothetical protein
VLPIFLKNYSHDLVVSPSAELDNVSKLDSQLKTVSHKVDELTAFNIVIRCAGAVDLTKKLGDIPALNPLVFQSCVQAGVRSAGYKPDNFPASPSTTVLDVVNSVQGSSK